MTFVAPDSHHKSFTCPHCGVYARQYKWGYGAEQQQTFAEAQVLNAPIRVGKCEHCGKNCIWWMDALVYPAHGKAPPPNPDMPPDVLGDYSEAAKVYTVSPRGAAALLRLAVQKLMPHLGGGGSNINADIAALVQRGLSPQVQRALDVVRVTGNNAVHPGQIVTDDPSVAEQLFPLVNVIVEFGISMPKRIDDLYSKLPEASRQAIEKRDQGH